LNILMREMKMAENTLPDASFVEVNNKESPPPAEDVSKDSVNSGLTSSSELDNEGKVKKSRNTVILREVDPSATEAQILALVENNVDFKVISAREDVQNTWFVQFENEDQAKLAVTFLSKQTLCGKPVKARVKSEVALKSTSASWQPATVPQLPTMFMHPPTPFPTSAGNFQPIQSPPPGVVIYGGWGGVKPPSVARAPGSGAFKKVSSAPSGSANGDGPAGLSDQAPASSAQNGSKGNQRGPKGGARSNQDRRTKKTGSFHSPQASRPVQFQPHDFPSLSGQPVTTEPIIVPTPSPEAPRNSWAAIAKTAPETTNVSKKKEQSSSTTAESASSVTANHVSVPSVMKDTKESREVKETQLPDETPTENSYGNSHSSHAVPVLPPATEGQSSANRAASAPVVGQEQQADPAKKRGWEKPAVATAKKAVEAEVTDSSVPREKSEASKVAGAPAPASVASVAKESTKAEKKQEANGHVHGSSASSGSPVPPPAWGTKSFAQVIKEKPVVQAVQPTSSVPVKASGQWGDVEDDVQNISNTSTAAASKASKVTAQAQAASQEKAKLSSENSDWRRDAADRRKNEEQVSRSSRRSNGV